MVSLTAGIRSGASSGLLQSMTSRDTQDCTSTRIERRGHALGDRQRAGIPGDVALELGGIEAERAIFLRE